jgi:uncharacterized protein with von Willebrand factor type A (vWA) domain
VTGPVEDLVAFGRRLRAAGVPASPDRIQAFATAVAMLDPLVTEDVYWAGRLTLCADPDDIARFDLVFTSWVYGHDPRYRLIGDVAGRTRRDRVLADVGGEADDQSDEAGSDDDRPIGLAASDVELLRHRDYPQLSSAERAEVRRLIALLDPVGPPRASRRYHPARRGLLDAHRTVRAMLARGGEPAGLRRRARGIKPRRLVFLVDVSGSMTAYSDALLRVAHAAVRRRPSTEVFTMGTRLTRVTRELRHRDPDHALVAAGRAVPDWSGGTRLGEQLKAFCDRWGQRGTARGALVVLASDGWERGDAGVLGAQMARLRRLAHRVVWVNPHVAKPGFAPATAGLRAALPHVDDFLAGHDLAAYEQLARVLSGTVLQATSKPLDIPVADQGADRVAGASASGAGGGNNA